MSFSDINPVVVRNIEHAVLAGDFHATVEPNDPTPTPEEALAIGHTHMRARRTLLYKIRRFFAERIADIATMRLHKSTEIVGLENLKGISGGAIFTSNHFHPLDSTATRRVVRKLGGGKLNIVSRASNFAMTGFVGFLMNYTRTLPLLTDSHYTAREFTPAIGEMLGRGEFVLIYPEAAMWKNYRKPRPGMSGAYYLAAKFGVPIIPIFTEMQDSDGGISYRIHVGAPLVAGEGEMLRDAVERMQREDESFRISVYEKCYRRPYDSAFSPEDIAGYPPTVESTK